MFPLFITFAFPRYHKLPVNDKCIGADSQMDTKTKASRVIRKGLNNVHGLCLTFQTNKTLKIFLVLKM